MSSLFDEQEDAVRLALCVTQDREREASFSPIGQANGDLQSAVVSQGRLDQFHAWTAKRAESLHERREPFVRR